MARVSAYALIEYRDFVVLQALSNPIKPLKPQPWE